MKVEGSARVALNSAELKYLSNSDDQKESYLKEGSNMV